MLLLLATVRSPGIDTPRRSISNTSFASRPSSVVGLEHRERVVASSSTSLQRHWQASANNTGKAI